MPFNTDKILVSSSDGHTVTVERAFSYVANNGEIFIVPEGAKSDGASVPKPFWNLIPPFGKHWMPAVLHDYLYRYTDVPKPRCDSLLLEAMLGNGVDIVVARIIYDGVRLGGDHAFTEDRLAEVQGG